MSRAIKFKNNDYLDSNSIVHNRELLSSLLDYFEQSRVRLTQITGVNLVAGNNTFAKPTAISDVYSVIGMTVYRGGSATPGITLAGFNSSNIYINSTTAYTGVTVNLYYTKLSLYNNQ